MTISRHSQTEESDNWQLEYHFSRKDELRRTDYPFIWRPMAKEAAVPLRQIQRGGESYVGYLPAAITGHVPWRLDTLAGAR